MRGLVYKEFYLGRKTYISFATITIMLALLGFLVALSTICGNIKGWAEANPEELKNTIQILTYLPILVSVFSVVGVEHSICGDYEAGWMNYSYTLPVKAGLAVGARYVTGLIVLGYSMVFGIIYAPLLSLVSGINLPDSIFKNILMLLVIAIIFISFDVPMSYRLKTSRAVSTRFGIFFVVVYVMAFVVFAIKMDAGGAMEQSEGQILKSIQNIFEGIRDVVVYGAVLIIPVALGLSFMVSEKLYVRREK